MLYYILYPFPFNINEGPSSNTYCHSTQRHIGVDQTMGVPESLKWTEKWERETSREDWEVGGGSFQNLLKIVI